MMMTLQMQPLLKMVNLPGFGHEVLLGSHYVSLLKSIIMISYISTRAWYILVIKYTFAILEYYLHLIATLDKIRLLEVL